MLVNKYIKDNNIIHDVEINNFKDNIVLDSIYNYNEELTNKLRDSLELNNGFLNLRYIKEYINYGTNPNIGRVIRQNINCYKNVKDNNIINVYYDLTTKYNEDCNVILNRFVITYNLVKQLINRGYKVNFIPVLFLKAFDSLENNEYVFIKFNNLDIDRITEHNFINNNDVSRIMLPEIIKKLDINNKDALDYNGYLLERSEKECIIGLNNNDLLVDMFTSDNLFNGNLEHDSEVYYKKLNLKL